MSDDQKRDLTSLTQVPSSQGVETPAPSTAEAIEIAAEIPVIVTEDEFASLDSVPLREDEPQETFLRGTQLGILQSQLTEQEPVIIETESHMDSPPIDAPPANLEQAVRPTSTPSLFKNDLSEVKKFGDKLAIGAPGVEASPAFSLKVISPTGRFSEAAIKTIEAALEEEDLGVRFDDVKVQLSIGRLFVPRISEYAAILIANKLRDCVENIELDLAPEIFESSADEPSADLGTSLLDSAHLNQHREEVHELENAPQSEADVFSTNLHEVEGFQITRILSLVTASRIVAAEVVEKQNSPELEKATELVTKELISNAFKLAANGVIGVDVSLRPIESFRDESGKIRRGYRLFGSGTAIRARKRG
ncbi:MAG: hypothetical protein AB1540_05710 [Bdellovibrionota bacterium]